MEAGNRRSLMFLRFCLNASRMGCAVLGTKEDVLRNWGLVGVMDPLNSSWSIARNLKLRLSPIIYLSMKMRRVPFVETETSAMETPVVEENTFVFLNFHHGMGSIIPGEKPRQNQISQLMKNLINPQCSPSTCLVNQHNIRVWVPLRRFIIDWHHFLSFRWCYAWRFWIRNTRTSYPKLEIIYPMLSNIYRKRYPERLEKIISILSDRVPRLEAVETQLMMDGRRLLKIKDAPFEQPTLAQFASDGTLKLLSYLTLFSWPTTAAINRYWGTWELPTPATFNGFSRGMPWSISDVSIYNDHGIHRALSMNLARRRCGYFIGMNKVLQSVKRALGDVRNRADFWRQVRSWDSSGWKGSLNSVIH